MGARIKNKFGFFAAILLFAAATAGGLTVARFGIKPVEAKEVFAVSGMDETARNRRIARLFDKNRENCGDENEEKEGSEMISKICGAFIDSSFCEDDNFVFSPLSLAYCAAATFCGATGEMKKELDEAFGGEAELYSFAEEIKNRFSADRGGARAAIAASLWINSRAASVRPEFGTAVKDKFDAEVFSLPFGEETPSKINEWCREKTEGEIKKVVESVSPDDPMNIASAILIKSQWSEPITETEKGVFHCLTAGEAEAEFMTARGVGYFCACGAEGIVKPLDGGFSFVAARSLENEPFGEFLLRAGKNSDKFMSSVKSFATAKFPAFKIESNLDVIPTLRALGISLCFTTACALGHAVTGGAKIAEASQSSTVEIDVRGVKAASVTDFGIARMCLPPRGEKELVFDRPFAFFIIDEKGEPLPVFVGAVTKI